MHTEHHAAVMEDIRELAVDFKRLASAFKIPPDKMKALEYKHRNALDVWDALCDVVLEWLKWNCDLTTESGNPNRRWLVNAVKSINNELGIRLEEKYINDPC